MTAEDVPAEENRVELDATVKDSNGIPAAHVVYGFSENTLRMLELPRDLLSAARATEILDDEPYPWTSHFMGTARTGTDSKSSVVNQWHQTHEIPDLFLVDGSSFVTSGAAEVGWICGHRDGNGDARGQTWGLCLAGTKRNEVQ